MIVSWADSRTPPRPVGGMGANTQRWAVLSGLLVLFVAPWMVLDLGTGHTLIGVTTPSAVAVAAALLWWWQSTGGISWWLAQHEARPLHVGTLDPLAATVLSWVAASVHDHQGDTPASPVSVWVIEDGDPNLAVPFPGHLVVTSAWLDTWPNRPDDEDRLLLDRAVWQATDTVETAWVRASWLMALPGVLVERLEALAASLRPAPSAQSAAARVAQIQQAHAARRGRGRRKRSRLVVGFFFYYPFLLGVAALLRTVGRPTTALDARWAAATPGGGGAPTRQTLLSRARMTLERDRGATDMRGLDRAAWQVCPVGV